MTTLRPGLVLALLCGLAACSSSGGGDDNSNAFDDLEAKADGMMNAVQDESYSDPATLPTTGTATYDGVMGLNMAAIPDTTLQGYDMAGDLSLTVNFASSGGQVTGTADHFADLDGNDVSGSLIIDNGSLNRSGVVGIDPTISADVGGALTTEDGTTYDVDAGLTGDFSGEDHDHAFGAVTGTACVDGDCQGLEGGFVGER